MKFIKITTKHNVQYMENMVKKFEYTYIKNICDLYNSFKCIEFTTNEGFEAMYAIINDLTIEKLFNEYVNCEISFTYEDITKFVLFGNELEIPEEQKKEFLNQLISEFIDEYLDLNIVLDKISERGISSLTEKDKKVLINF